MITNEDIKHYIKEAIDTRARFSVKDSGDREAFVEYGVYSIKQFGMTKEVQKSSTAIHSIMFKLAMKYTNFTYQGITYVYHAGSWRDI